ncbi:uncharacterized protein LOC129229680 [Uloborus diversus]|uniref:uncharacterized protein LOC129229680 n=1 Tax=Uloborus diversus TaxID=327109 RepID=UPI00240934BA|nr:uncharacterized protein LOC129229680 [Uloborus diversus]
MAVVEVYMVASVVLACVLSPVQVESKAIVQRRDTAQWCSRSTPCGWEVYRPFMRNVEYFIKSPCDCQQGSHCVRVFDDISISAYVYLCRSQNEDIAVWPHDNYSSQTPAMV